MFNASSSGEKMEALLTVTRLAHVGSAIVVVGGTVFLRFILMPVAERTLSSADHELLRDKILELWRKVVHRSIIVFLISGFINYFRSMPDHQGDPFYHSMMGSKIILAMAVFFISMALVGRSPRFESFRNQRAKWLSINIVLALVIVVISGVLKVRYKYSPPASPVVKASNPIQP
jgi:uncharacterized membrane protein